MASSTAALRLRDTKGDDWIDKVKLLRALECGGNHGKHALLTQPDGNSMYVRGANGRMAALFESNLAKQVTVEVREWKLVATD